MRDGVTLKRRLSLAGRKPRISPAVVIILSHVTLFLSTLGIVQQKRKLMRKRDKVYLYFINTVRSADTRMQLFVWFDVFLLFEYYAKTIMRVSFTQCNLIIYLYKWWFLFDHKLFKMQRNTMMTQ